MTTQVHTGQTPEHMDRFYSIVRLVGRFWLWFFFKHVDVVRAERVPAGGPVLLCINHPNNLIDSLLVGSVLRRKVHYLATAALFRNPVVARFLSACGAIPVYRKQDDPTKMDKNADAFAACFRTLEAGRLIGIYPEGTTHSESRVQRIKTGAARIALDYEASRRGAPLALIPVGLSFEARKSFRGHVRVSFGDLIPLGAYAAVYREDPVKAVEALTTAIQWGMEAEVLHVARPERQDLIRAVEQIYAGDLIRELQDERGLGTRQIDPLRLSRTIADAVAHFERRDPDRVERLWAEVQRYRAMLAAHRVRDQAVRARAERAPRRARLRRSWEASLGLPFFAYGLLVNGLPYLLPRWLARRTARKETDYATTRLLASIVAFPLFWAGEIWIVWRFSSLGWALVFALSLPLSGLLAYRYLGGVGRLRSQLRFGWLSLTHHHSATRLLTERQALVSQLERAKDDYLAATRGSSF
ncbi:MAG TPA: lysophospholipid acyltransferase family protein [Candidatus Nitrosotalea sp.]|jgi:1-acyl-sn-glycerol-3-phosphate acyltransferase|nr:lysophospholipid acyltransferase family protein [Candidatus Nitrosotalea sp.]